MTVRAILGRAVRAQWPILLVGLIFLVAFVLAGANFWRRGSLLIGIGVGVAAVLRLALPDGFAVRETSNGRYLVEGEIVPATVATVTSFCAQVGVLPGELQVNQRSLDDVYLELTGREIRP